jgi:putative FmdB family regulatory protein
MPIYEYECQKCGSFEVTQRITEKALGRCPTCKGKVKKLISNTSFQLKGTGWYVTDYARKDKSPSKDGNGAKPSTSEGKSDSNKDASTNSSEKSSTKKSETSSSTST